MILLMGGTKDARDLVAALNLAFPRMMIVATAVSGYGADLLRKQGGCVVLQGAMDADSLVRFIREKEVQALVDATHPYAERASQEAHKAALDARIPYFRYERPPTDIQAGNGVYFAPDFTSAATTAGRFGRTVFLTIGSRRLAEFVQALPPDKRVIARVLPEEDSIRQCREAGLVPADIVALQGPVSQSLNAAMFLEYKAEVVVSKDSGDTGGTPEKIAAAKQCRIPIVFVRRPNVSYGLSSPAQVISALKNLIRGKLVKEMIT
jgi:precorrin-6A/cobalt-precorrin-6A reductase